MPPKKGVPNGLSAVPRSVRSEARMSGTPTAAMSITEARMLDLIKFSQTTSHLYRKTRTAALHDSIIYYPGRAIQLWQILPDHWVVVWINASADKVTVLPTHSDAKDYFNRAAYDLSQQPEPPTITRYPQKKG